MYAVVKTGGKQYTVAPGDEVRFEKLSGQAGDTVTFDNILLTSDENGVSVGNPTLGEYKVTGKILRHGRDKKVLVFKYKRRKGYRRKNGHRQAFSLVKIEDIGKPG
jgi:large subunit ribosomal protein L21